MDKDQRPGLGPRGLPPPPRVNPSTHLRRLTDRPLTWQKVVQSTP